MPVQPFGSGFRLQLIYMTLSLLSRADTVIILLSKIQNLVNYCEDVDIIAERRDTVVKSEETPRINKNI